MRQNIYRRLEELERIHTAVRQAEAYLSAPSGAEVMRALLGLYAAEPLAGESRAETLARAAGLGTRELKDLLWARAHAAGPAGKTERSTRKRLR